MSTHGCDLCGLPMIGRPVRHDDHEFCCEGCRRVWMAADSSGLGEVLGSARDRSERAARASQRKATAAAAAGARRDTLSVSGMWCASCATVLEDAMLAVPGVLDVEVSYAASLARVTFDPEQTDARRLADQARLLGYSVEPARMADAADDSVEDAFLRFFVSAAISMWIMWPALFVLYPEYAQDRYAGLSAWSGFVGVEALVVLLYGGWPFLVGAWRAARVGRATMDTLVVLGTWTGFFYSVWATITGEGPTYFDSAAMITTIVLGGRWLESLGRRDAARAVKRLSDVSATQHAWLLGESGDPSGARQTPASELSPGDLIAVRAGERVPVDGTVVSGRGAFDVSLLTGEPLPRTIGPGDDVWAGAIDLEALVVVRVERAGEDTLSGRLAAIAEDAVFAKSTVQRLTDKIAGVFVPLVIVLAAMTAITTLFTAGSAEAVDRAVAVLIVACPCALGLATPLAVVNAVGAGARHSLLLRGGPTLEGIGEIGVVAFDKTGTLTSGRLDVVAVLPVAGRSATDVLELAATVEHGQPHPVAQAIVARAGGAVRGIATDITPTAGRGVRGVLEDRSVVVGSATLLAEQGVALDAGVAEQVAQQTVTGSMATWVAYDGAPVGAVLFEDPIRPEAPAVVSALQEMDLRVAVISGDLQPTTDHVATAVGAELSYGEVLPHDKERTLVELRGGGPGAVAFVGDGVNDAAALAAANIAISLSGASDVATLAADAVALDETRPLASLPALVRIARTTRRVIRQNLAWAFLYNVATIPLAVMGVLDPIWAAVAMAVSSLAVVANSWRVQLAGGRTMRL